MSRGELEKVVYKSASLENFSRYPIPLSDNSEKLPAFTKNGKVFSVVRTFLG